MVNRIVWLDRCESTNDEAWARADVPGFRAVASTEQTAGRGRRGRRWFSPPGAGLYLTWLSRPRLDQTAGTALPLLAAVAVAERCAEWGLKPTLKWPNDVQIEGRKLAGILCEARGSTSNWKAAVGVGLNLHVPPGGYPDELAATALSEHLQTVPTPLEAAELLVERLEWWLRRVEIKGMAPVIEAWSRFAPPAGARYRQGGIEGTFAGLAPDGALRLRVGAAVRLIHAGEVELVRQLADLS